MTTDDEIMDGIKKYRTILENLQIILAACTGEEPQAAVERRVRKMKLVEKESPH